MTPEQLRFIRLHQAHVVTAWRWLFQGGMLRAEAEGHTATLAAGDVGELFDLGLVERGHAFDLKLTAEGMQV